MALAQEKSMYQAAAAEHVVPDVLWTDTEGTIQWVGSMRSLEGVAEPDLVGTSIADLPHVAPEGRATLVALVADATTAHPIDAILMIERPNASRSTLCATAIRTPSPDGGSRVLVSLARPRGVPDLRRLRELDHLAGSGRIALQAAHDLNNVMLVLGLGLQDLIDETPAQSPHADRLTELNEMVKRATHVARRFRSARPTMPMHIGVIELGDLLRELRGSLAMLAGPRMCLAVTSTSWPIRVRGGRAALEQALMNLVSNASDASRGVGHIVVTATQMSWPGGRVSSGGYLSPGQYGVLQVQDDGPGLSSAQQEQLFEPFFTTKPVGVGTGLGLTLVAETALEAGGGVHVESTPGQGATFQLLLPMVA